MRDNYKEIVAGVEESILINESLIMVENLLADMHSKNINRLGYSDEAFKAITTIFVTALNERMTELQEDEGMSASDRIAMSSSLGREIRKLTKTYTGIDTKKLLRH